MNEPFKIKYNKSRFPIQQRRSDGTLGCRGCGGAIPKGRQTWCSKRCVDTYDPQRVIFFVKQRDKGVCAECGFETQMEWQRFYKECREKNIPHDSIYAKMHMSSYPRGAEIDHIIPFSEGGLTVLENMRTLCRPCHRNRTRHWRKQRVESRKGELLFA